MVEEHLDICLGWINVEGINAEVAAGQWEYQCFAKGAKQAGDEMWVSRYLLERLGEKYGLAINWHPKPLGAPIGMVLVCTPTSRMKHCVHVDRKKPTKQFVKLPPSGEEHITVYGMITIDWLVI